MDLLNVANESLEVLDRKAPLILTIAGIGLGAGAVGLCGMASYKAYDIVKNIASDPQYDENKLKAFGAYCKHLIPLYIPVAITGAGAVICLVKSYDISTKRLAAATALAEISMETLRLYKDRAKKIIGEEKEKEISKAVKEEQIVRPASEVRSDVIWFVDSITNQEFLSTKEALRIAELELNLKLHSEMYVCIDEWIDILNDECCFKIDGDICLKHQQYTGNQNGWREGYPVYLSFVDYHTADGKPALRIDYNLPPIVNYRDRY